jgi:hypothetical protein
MTTKTGRENRGRCPLCGRRVKRDRAGRGFRVHVERPDLAMLATPERMGDDE